MKKTDKKSLPVHVACGVFALFASFYMYDFYKCLSGFIANGFREPHVMLPMVLSFLLPVICFLFFFYDFYVKSVGKLAKLVYSCFVTVYAAVDVAFIFSNMELYASNNRLGVYDALPSFIMHFPYDMIVLHLALIVLQIFNAISAIKPSPLSKKRDSLKPIGTCRLCLIEYVALSVLAIVVFVFFGSALTAIFCAYENALFNVRFVLLLLWVLIAPMMNLLYLVFKPEKRELGVAQKAAWLGAGIAVNLILAALIVAAELTYPDFMVHVGKPLFLIAFSISLPIEMGIIFGIMALGTLIMAAKLIILAVKRKTVK